MKKFLSLILIFSLLFTLCACNKDKREKYTGQVWDCFDTVISLISYQNSQEEFDELLDYVQERYEYYNELFDIYHSYSGLNNIKTINDNAGIKPVEVSDEIIDLIKLGISMYELTDGESNIAMGSVLRIWHIARETAENDETQAYVPDMIELKDAALHANIEDIVIDEANSTVYLKDGKMSLDVGSIGKGYATEKITEELIEKGETCFLITAGASSIRAVGNKPDGSSWTMAAETDPDYTPTEISGLSVSTSGPYQRYYMVDGVRYHHIIDSETLMPENNYTSLTLICEDCGLCDGLSTAIYNMTLEEGLNFVNNIDGLYAMWIGLDNTKTYSEGYEQLIKK